MHARLPSRCGPLSALLLALALLAVTAPVSAQVAPPRDARNASYWQRVDHPPADALQPPLDWYRPLTPLRGAPGPFLPAAAEGRTTVPAQALEEASQYAEATAAQALIVVHRGVVQIERYYDGADAASVFSSHSFAKTLAAMAVGAAVADGRIASLDQPASKWLPEWRDEARRAITLRQLMTMSGGFRTPPSTDPASHYMQLHYGADVEQTVRDARPAYAPGREFAFDNDNLHPLGLVVERATGRRYADYVSRRLWRPLGAGDGSMLLDREGGRAMNYCCVLATPRDWVRIGQTLLDGGLWQGRRVLPTRFVDAMREPSAANPNFGLQLFVGAAWQDPRLNRRAETQRASLPPAAAPDLFYLGGAAGQLMAIVPSEQLVVLRVGKASPAWRDAMLPNLLLDGLKRQQTAERWSWLYDWRLATRPSAGNPWVHEPNRPQYWPTERVAGRPDAPLPRRRSTCFDDARLAPALAEIDRVKSYAFLVWRDGAIEIEHYGSGYGADVRAESASMHKSVLGLLVGQAIADGAIAGLDEPVSRWLTEWAGDARGAITVRQLLQMESGLAPIPFDLKPGSPNSRFLFGADANAVPLAAMLADAPGSRFEYGSSVSQLLGLVVQRATGRRYAELLSQRLWQPIGAADARVALDRPGGMARTSGSLLARPEDWLRIGLLFANGGRVGERQVVAPSWLDAMTAASPANPNYGLQLWRASPHAARRTYNSASDAGVPAKEAFLADDMVFLDGAGAQRVYVSPRERLVIVRIGPPAPDWDDALVPNAVVAAARACRAAQ